MSTNDSSLALVFLVAAENEKKRRELEKEQQTDMTIAALQRRWEALNERR